MDKLLVLENKSEDDYLLLVRAKLEKSGTVQGLLNPQYDDPPFMYMCHRNWF